MTLRLMVSTHHPDAREKFISISMGNKRWDDGVIGAFRWFQPIWMSLIKAKSGSTVLQSKSTPFGDNSSSESAVIAIDE
jgi:hypothetical protein